MKYASHIAPFVGPAIGPDVLHTTNIFRTDPCHHQVARLKFRQPVTVSCAW